MVVSLVYPTNYQFSYLPIKLSSSMSPINHDTEPLEFAKSAKKDLSRFLRTEAAIRAIDKKANSSKYTNLWPKAVLEALTDAIHHNRWESALKIFGLLRKQQWYIPRCQTYTKLLMMLSKCRLPNQASLLYETMLLDGLKPTIDVYTALVSVYSASGLLDKAIDIVEDMKSTRDCKPDAFTYSILIRSCLILHCFDMIGSILNEMFDSGIDCSIITYNILIEGYGKAKRFEMMEDSLADLIQSENCCPDIFTLNSIVGAYGRCKKITEMEKWFEDFQMMGLNPDVMTYNILIKAYGSCGMHIKMMYVFEFMKKRFFSPSLVTYNSIIDAFGKAGDIVKMNEMFLEMKHRGIQPNSITYTSLVSAYSKAGLMEKISSVMRQVENSNVVLDTPFFNCVINAYGNGGDIERMMNLFMVMKGSGCKPDHVTFATIVQAYRAQGMIESARDFERKMIYDKNIKVS